MRIRLIVADVLVFLAIVAIGLMVATQLGANQERWPEIIPSPRWPKGSIEGLLTAGAALLIYVAFRAARFRRWYLRLGLVLPAFILLWFAAIDFSIHHSWCNCCDRLHSEASFRCYRWPLWTTSPPDGNNMPSDIAAELGVPCQHDWHREQWVRVWGLCIPYPLVNGTLCFAESELKMDEVRPHLRAMATENPALPDEFHREVIIAQNNNYLRQFMTDLRKRLDAAK